MSIDIGNGQDIFRENMLSTMRKLEGRHLCHDHPLTTMVLANGSRYCGTNGCSWAWEPALIASDECCCGQCEAAHPKPVVSADFDTAAMILKAKLREAWHRDCSGIWERAAADVIQSRLHETDISAVTLDGGDAFVDLPTHYDPGPFIYPAYAPVPSEIKPGEIVFVPKKYMRILNHIDPRLGFEIKRDVPDIMAATRDIARGS